MSAESGLFGCILRAEADFACFNRNPFNCETDFQDFARTMEFALAALTYERKREHEESILHTPLNHMMCKILITIECCSHFMKAVI